MKIKHKLVEIRDQCILIGLFMAILALFACQMIMPRIFSGSGYHELTALIYQQKELFVLPVNTLPTEKESEWDLEGPAGGLHLMYVPREGFCVRSASCPEHICVHTGFINKAGQSIVCVPNKIVIRLGLDVKGEEDMLDGLLR